MSRTRTERRKSSSTRWKNGLLDELRVYDIREEAILFRVEYVYDVHIGTFETMTGIYRKW